jgi:centromere protein V
MTELITHSGGCHCGRVRFEVVAPKELSVSDCNCSMCSKAGERMRRDQSRKEQKR